MGLRVCPNRIYPRYSLIWLPRLQRRPSYRNPRKVRENSDSLLALLSEALGESDGFEHRFGFVDRLLKFVFRSGIVDPAAAGLDVGLAIFYQGGANGDAAIEIAAEGKVADASPVRAARSLLKLGNDLHCANLGRATERARRESGAHQIVGSLVF